MKKRAAVRKSTRGPGSARVAFRPPRVVATAVPTATTTRTRARGPRRTSRQGATATAVAERESRSRAEAQSSGKRLGGKDMGRLGTEREADACYQIDSPVLDRT
jgi:hypothetical protein